MCMLARCIAHHCTLPEPLGRPHRAPRRADMPIDLGVALGAELDPIEFSWTSSDVQLYHLGAWRRCRPDEPTGAALPGRQRPSGAAHVRQRRGEPPHDRAAQGAVSRHRHRADQRSARQRSGFRACALAGSGSARSSRLDRDLGQRQGRGDRQRDHCDRPRWPPPVDDEASIFARGEGGFDGERGPSTSVEQPDRAADMEVRLPILPQRPCSTGCAATATRCTRIRNLLPRLVSAPDPARPMHLRHRVQRDGRRVAGRR
jgi:hypothetical protein